jgi:hypothetical protein
VDVSSVIFPELMYLREGETAGELVVVYELIMSSKNDRICTNEEVFFINIY